MFDDAVLSAGTGVDASRGASVPSLALRSFAFITPAGNPNSDQWEDSGNQSVEIEVDAGGMNLRARVRVGRVNSTGTVLQTGAYSAFQTMQASRTFTDVAAPVWTNGQEDCDNRYFIEVEVENLDTMMALTLTVGLGTVANEVVTTIAENAGGCAGAVSVKFINQGGEDLD